LYRGKYYFWDFSIYSTIIKSIICQFEGVKTEESDMRILGEI